MSISTPPPAAPPKKKSGCGCLGCGCGILVLLVVGIIALFIVGIVMFYDQVTSTTPATIPAFTGDPSVLNQAEQKITTFQHDAAGHHGASLHLTSDEINALIEASPDIAKTGIHAYITLTDNQAHVQASAPLDKLFKGLPSGRYVNFDTNLVVTFNSATHSVELTPQTLQLGSMPAMNTDSSQGNSVGATYVRTMMPPFNQAFNQGLRQNGGVEVLDHARNISIKDGELVIETD